MKTIKQFLLEKLEVLGKSIEDLANEAEVPIDELNGIIDESEKISPKISYKLEQYLGIDEDFLLNLQESHDINKELDDVTHTPEVHGTDNKTVPKNIPQPPEYQIIDNICQSKQNHNKDKIIDLLESIDRKLNKISNQLEHSKYKM